MTGQAGERSGDEALEQSAAIARELTEVTGLQDTMDRVVELAQDALVNCDGASLMLVHRGKIHTPAYTSQTAFDNDQAQYATGQGPCLDAIMQEHTVVLNDLENESRWPAFREQALQLGVRSYAAFRLFIVEDTIGALDLYSTRKDAFDRRSLLIGQVFATHAAIAVKGALTEGGLRTALESRDIIGQAKGILMAYHRLPADMAFDVLRERSQRTNRPLRDVAREIAATGLVPSRKSPAQPLPPRAANP